jgi:hypothetical protein
VSPSGRPSLRVASEFRRVRAGNLGQLSGRSRAVQEMAAALAASRRAYRAREQEIEALREEVARLRKGDTDQGDGEHAPGGARAAKGQHCRQHERELAWMSSVMLVLRQGNLALKAENASLRVELERLRARGHGPRLLAGIGPGR